MIFLSVEPAAIAVGFFSKHIPMWDVLSKLKEVIL